MKKHLFPLLLLLLLLLCAGAARDGRNDQKHESAATTIKPVISAVSTSTPSATTTTSELPTTTEEDDKESETKTETEAETETETEASEEDEDEESEDGVEEGSGEGEKDSKTESDPNREVSTDEAEENSGEDTGSDACSFNQFLSGLNISEYLPEDRAKLRSEFEAFSHAPERIRHSPSVNNTMQKLKRLFNFATGFANRHELRSGFTALLQQNYDLLLDLELEPACTTSIISIIAAIRRSELWALKFIDSMAKPPSGLLSGVTSFLGDFDQCLSATSPESAMEEFTGQYCLIRPVLPIPELNQYNGETDEALIRETPILSHLEQYGVDAYMSKNIALKLLEHLQSHRGRFLNFGICFPSTCGPAQLERTLNKMLYPIVGIPFEVDQSSCWTESRRQDSTQILPPSRSTNFAYGMLTMMAMIVGLATTYHIYAEYVRKRSLRLSFVTSFSALMNTRTLFAPGGRLPAFDVLRLAIVILIGLTNAFYGTPLTYGLERLTHSVPYELLHDWKYFFIRAPVLLNDGLLVISGALFVQSVVKNINSSQESFNGLLFFSRRWLRLVAPLFGSIMFLFVLPYTADGPFWDRVAKILLPPCQSSSSLTSSLLFYSNWNFVKANHTAGEAEHVCNPDTWFLSILFQLNLLLVIVVVFIYQSPQTGLRIIYLLIAAGVVLNISPKLFHKGTLTYYEITKQPSFWNFRRNFYLYHQNILQYIGSFAMGLLLGYALLLWNSKKHSMEKPKIKKERNGLRTKFVVLNSLAVATIAIVFAWVNRFFILNDSPNEISVLLFFSVGRLAASIAFAWLIYVAVTGKTLFLNQFLSISAFQPFGRLSYSIFLVQTLVQYHRFYSIKDTFVMTFRGTIETYVNDFFVSSAVAFVLHLLFEGPALRINELLAHGDDDDDDNLRRMTSPEHFQEGAHHHHHQQLNHQPSVHNDGHNQAYEVAPIREMQQHHQNQLRPESSKESHNLNQHLCYAVQEHSAASVTITTGQAQTSFVVSSHHQAYPVAVVDTDEPHSQFFFAENAKIRQTQSQPAAPEADDKIINIRF